MINFGMGSANAATVMDLLSRHRAQGGAVPGQVRRAQAQEPAGRPDPADRGDPRRRHLQRLPAAGSAGAAGVRPAARDLHHDPRPRATTTGPAPSTPPTAASGSTTRTSRNTCASCAAWRSTWRPRRSSPPASPTAFRPARCCWCRDQPMIPEGVKTEASDRKVTRRLRRDPHQDRHRGAEADPPPRQERQAPALRRVTAATVVQKNPACFIASILTEALEADYWKPYSSRESPFYRYRLCEKTCFK